MGKNIKIYHEASSDEVRDAVLMNIWESMQNRGGRFLLQVEDGQLWERLELQPALYKIRQAFDFLCMQLYAPKTPSPNGNNSGKSRDDEDLFFGWNDIFD